MFDRVLVANRGEIACRVISACRELGLTSVAVFSEADAEARHVRLADQAVAIGPAEAAASYLDVGKLVDAAATTGAGALHPGYGFRAESAELAAACEERGVVFLGPRAETIAAMGDKREARKLASAAGVPVVPGYEGEPAGAAAAAREIGFPVLVKAALGGGGKGMQRVDDEAGLPEALASASRIAAGAFGDGAVFVERLLEDARHVEVQVLGDGDGGAVHVLERECSLQRRHQKVIEEAPSPALDEATRAAMCAAAVALAKQVGYRSAGTVEFLLAPDGGFYFLEMNTRIQVEHPVTEMLTGLDLVKAQLRLAAGAALPEQASIAARGWAVEARLTAEDTDSGFLPQAGELLRFDVPRDPFLRVDTGFEAGSDVPVHYDSLLAKIVTWGRDREEAFTRLRIAVDGTIVHGVKTNLPLLRYLTRDERVLAGELSTTLLEAELLAPYLERATGMVPPMLLAAAALSETLATAPSDSSGPAGASGLDGNDPFRRIGGFRVRGDR